MKQTPSDTPFSRPKIGLLGGSFNPAHAGHRAVSLYALQRLGLDAVIWLVSPQNPLKSKEDMASFAERLASAHKVARHPRLFVSDIETRLGTRYTVDTIKALQKRYPDTRFVWLMGADNLRSFHRWRNWQKLFSLVSIAVFRRPAYVAGRGIGKAAQCFDFAHLPRHKARELAKKKPPAWCLLDNPMNALSATALRTQESKQEKVTTHGDDDKKN